jgi:toxin secretion/phage lysis holin
MMSAADWFANAILASQAVFVVSMAWLMGAGFLIGLLMLLMIMDVVSGFSRGIIQQDISSELTFSGMNRKAMELLMVAVSYAIAGFSGLTNLGDLVAAFYIIHEITSIVENLSESGVPVPGIILDVLAVMNKKRGGAEVERDFSGNGPRA